MKTISSHQLQEITRRLVDEFQPEQVILFGSHAWGLPGEDSDLDLLVVVASSDQRPVQRAIEAHRSLRGLAVPVDVLVKTRAELERYRHVHASLECEILERGKVLYGGKTDSGQELVGQGATGPGISPPVVNRT